MKHIFIGLFTVALMSLVGATMSLAPETVSAQWEGYTVEECGGVPPQDRQECTENAVDYDEWLEENSEIGQDGDSDTRSIICQNNPQAEECQEGDLGGFINNVVEILLLIIGAVAVIMLIIGGFRYVVSGGDPKAVEGAKNTIIYALVGVVVAFLAYAAVNFVVDSLGGDSSQDEQEQEDEGSENGEDSEDSSAFRDDFIADDEPLKLL